MEQKEIWNKIADSWMNFRDEPVKFAQDYIKTKKGRFLDFGCGSGRNLCKIEGLEIYGTDFSEKQIEHARDKSKKIGIKADLRVADCCNLPFEDNFFDSAMCISVIHCIKGREKRLKAMKELQRVLKPGSEALISVWRKVKGRKKDEEVTWNLDGEKVKRYYHFYNNEEFLEDLNEAGFEIVKIYNEDFSEKDSKFIKRNINVIVRK